MNQIAVIDRESENRKRTVKLLERHKFDVQEFQSTTDFLDHATPQSNPQLIILNYYNDKSNLSDIAVIRVHFGPSPAIILGVPETNEELVCSAIEAGVTDVLESPFAENYLCVKAQFLLKPRKSHAKTKKLSQTMRITPPTPPVEPGDANTRFAHFKLVDELGKGGMGTVYRAINEQTKQTVALKVLHLGNDEKVLARFNREIELLHKVKNPHVVRILEAGRYKTNHYLAMELIEGFSAKQQLESTGRFEPTLLINVLTGVLKALKALNKAGMVHRDIKPGNILISKQNVIKLVDFGLAKELGDHRLTHTGEALGTPYYLSPEMIRGKQADIRSDMFALGVTVYELATGQKAFPGHTALEVFRNVFHAELPDLRKRRPDMPASLTTAILELMQRTPDDRPQTPTEALQKISQLQQKIKAQTKSLGPLKNP